MPVSRPKSVLSTLARCLVPAALLAGCVSDSGGSGGGGGAFLDTSTPIIQQRTDIFLRATELNCMNQTVEGLIEDGSRRKLPTGVLARGHWPDPPFQMPVPYGSRAHPRQADIATWRYQKRPDPIPPVGSASLALAVQASIKASAPEYFTCHVEMSDVDIRRVVHWVAQRTGALGQAYGSWRYKNELEEKWFFTGSLALPSIIVLQAVSRAANKPFYHGNEPIGFSNNVLYMDIVIGVPTRDLPPDGFGDLLNEVNARADARMRQDVAAHTARLQGVVTADYDRRIQATAARDAEVKRKIKQYNDEYYASQKSTAEIFADAMSQSAQNMARQQRALNRIEQQAGTRNSSQRRLDGAAEAGRNGTIPGGSSGSSSGGGSGSALTLCQSVYVPVPAKYEGEIGGLYYGCSEVYQTEAEVRAIYDQQARAIDKRDAASAASRDRRQAQRNAARDANAVVGENPCKNVKPGDICTVEKK